MTVTELQAKGFNVSRYPLNPDAEYCAAIGFRSWGKNFDAVGQTYNEAADQIWSDFCDFINGKE